MTDGEDVARPDGWWQASDGKWYPPESHPDPLHRQGFAMLEAGAGEGEYAATPAGEARPPSSTPRVDGGRRWLSWAMVALIALIGPGVGALLGVLDQSNAKSSLEADIRHSIAGATESFTINETFSDGSAPAQTVHLSTQIDRRTGAYSFVEQAASQGTVSVIFVSGATYDSGAPIARVAPGKRWIKTTGGGSALLDIDILKSLLKHLPKRETKVVDDGIATDGEQQFTLTLPNSAGGSSTTDHGSAKSVALVSIDQNGQVASITVHDVGTQSLNEEITFAYGRVVRITPPPASQVISANRFEQLEQRQDGIGIASTGGGSAGSAAPAPSTSSP